MYREPNVYSSYSKNKLGKTIYDIVIELKPKKVVEFGILHGYSTFCIAQALRDLDEGGTLLSYDLFDEFEYRHGTRKEAEQLVKKHNLEKFVKIEHGDFYKWVSEPDEFDLLHIDIANDGDVLEFVSNTFKNKNILFEGGSKERDREPWMHEHNKRLMYPLKQKVNYEILNSKWPSLSLIRGNKNVSL